MARDCQLIQNRRCSALVAVATCAALTLTCGSAASRRSAAIASESLEPGLTIENVLEVIERASARPDSWALGIQECADTSDVFTVRHASGIGGYAVTAISNIETRAQERWTKQYPNREVLVAELQRLPMTRCSRARVWFGQEWEITVSLDDAGRIRDVEAPIQFD